jgi:hypothetical protein
MMASKQQCDHCGKQVSRSAAHPNKWLIVEAHEGLMEECCLWGPGGTGGCRKYDFCSWGCVAEYGAARDVIGDQLSLGDSGEM